MNPITRTLAMPLLAIALQPAFAAQAGAWAVRVHDPASSALACRVAAAIADHAGSAPSPWTQR